MRRHFHVGHGLSPEARAAKAMGKTQRGARRLTARADGKLIEQRVDPTVLARLREIQRSQ